mmetsp:Transcript_26563/g.69877  ORF Transcript_26563/g.69877 Transcript_26563/m.69877 type:complete len:258 (-) Transcript_26563:71-844(-)
MGTVMGAVCRLPSACAVCVYSIRSRAIKSCGSTWLLVTNGAISVAIGLSSWSTRLHWSIAKTASMRWASGFVSAMSERKVLWRRRLAAPCVARQLAPHKGVSLLWLIENGINFLKVVHMHGLRSAEIALSRTMILISEYFAHRYPFSFNSIRKLPGARLEASHGNGADCLCLLSFLPELLFLHPRQDDAKLHCDILQIDAALLVYCRMQNLSPNARRGLQRFQRSGHARFPRIWNGQVLTLCAITNCLKEHSDCATR